MKKELIKKIIINFGVDAVKTGYYSKKLNLSNEEISSLLEEIENENSLSSRTLSYTDKELKDKLDSIKSINDNLITEYKVIKVQSSSRSARFVDRADTWSSRSERNVLTFYTNFKRVTYSLGDSIDFSNKYLIDSLSQVGICWKSLIDRLQLGVDKEISFSDKEVNFHD